MRILDAPHFNTTILLYDSRAMMLVCIHCTYISHDVWLWFRLCCGSARLFP